MKITTKGQVTIPQHIRKFLGVAAHSDVEFRIQDNMVIIAKSSDENSEGRSISRFEALRGTKKNGMSTDEIMAATRGDS